MLIMQHWALCFTHKRIKMMLPGRVENYLFAGHSLRFVHIFLNYDTAALLCFQMHPSIKWASSKGSVAGGSGASPQADVTSQEVLLKHLTTSGSPIGCVFSESKRQQPGMRARQPQNPEASLKLVSKTFTLPFIAIRLLGSLQSLYAFIQVCFSLKNLFRLPSSLLYLLIVMQFCQARRLRNLQAIIQNFGFIQICLSLQGSLHNLQLMIQICFASTAVFSTRHFAKC